MADVIPINRHKVTFMQDSAVGEYPEMWITVFVQGDSQDKRQFAELFVRSRCRKADTPEEADLVIFSGGPDVDPLYYGEKPHPSVRGDVLRDKSDQELYTFCLEKGIPMLGICRGAQFLHVMNGGKLYQDVDKHFGDHRMWDMRNKQNVEPVSSVHHQMCIENKAGGMEVIAHSSGQSRERWLNDLDKETNATLDVEAFFYRETCCIGIQGHPEYRGYNRFGLWTLKLIEDLVVHNPDLMLTKLNGVTGSFYRMKKEFLEERKLLKAQGAN